MDYFFESLCNSTFCFPYGSFYCKNFNSMCGHEDVQCPLMAPTSTRTCVLKERHPLEWTNCLVKPNQERLWAVVAAFVKEIPNLQINFNCFSTSQRHLPSRTNWTFKVLVNILGGQKLIIIKVYLNFMSRVLLLACQQLPALNRMAIPNDQWPFLIRIWQTATCESFAMVGTNQRAETLLHFLSSLIYSTGRAASWKSHFSLPRSSLFAKNYSRQKCEIKLTEFINLSKWICHSNRIECVCAGPVHLIL